ncbi:MAG: sugar phosphate isomerase/epimerase [Oscillospiraceae bacterium]|jgi:sugar phosphate isomerase/epimerase|nr:sugar phosphate isomerase/epimerase [Oscillospiraceae bacterium]
MLIALQLYSIRDLLEKDVWGTLAQVKAAGFDGVEFAGFFDLSARELRARVMDLGLTPFAAHIPLQRFAQEEAQATADYVAALGLAYAIVPWTRADTVEDCQQTNSLLRAVTPVFAARGVGVGYHNHRQEFARLGPQNRYALDIIADGLDGVVELDTAWAQAAGVDPAAYAATLGQRVGPIHAKDLNRDYTGGPDEKPNVNIGQGIVDFSALFTVLRSAGTLGRGVVVEQEAFVGPPMEALAQSVAALRTLAQPI